MKRLIEPILALLLVLIAMAALFRGPLTIGFARVSADDLDGALQLALLEHWRNVLHGTVDWHTPAFFFPIDRTLGYNDGYLLYGLLYAGLRALGLQATVAQEFVHISFRILGFIGVWILARLYLQLSIGSAAFAALLSVLVNVVPVTVVNSQLALAGLAPYAFILVAEILIAAHRADASRAAWAFGGLGLLYGLWILTGYYMAWFSVVVLVCAAAAFAISDRRLFAATAIALSRGKMMLAASVGLLAAGPGLAAFLYVYLPKLRETGGHPSRAILDNLPNFPAHLINVGDDNLVWGSLAGAIYKWMTGAPPGGSNPVLSTAFTPILTAAFVYALVTMRTWTRNLDPGIRITLWTGATSVAVLYMLEMRYGPVAPWLVIAKVFPGAGGVRVVTRVNLILAIVAACVLASWLERSVASRSRWLAVIVGAVILAEQSSGIDLDRMQTSMVSDYLRGIPSPPSACSSFYVTNLPSTSLFWPGRRFQEADREWGATDIPAMLVAEHVGIPTVNGHASFIPQGWDLKFTSDSDYAASVYMYALRHNVLPGLCAFDLTTRRWSSLINKPKSPRTHPFFGTGIRDGETVSFATGELGVPTLTDGWSQPEPWGTWGLGTQSTLVIRLDDDISFQKGLTLRLTGEAFLPPKQSSKKVDVFVGENSAKLFLTTWNFSRDAEEKVVCIPPDKIPANRLLVLQLQADRSFSPANSENSSDERILDVGVSSLSIHAQSCSTAP
ncbi:MAG: hypothetical protein ACLPN5_10950 [Roseiarcus sp.]